MCNVFIDKYNVTTGIYVKLQFCRWVRAVTIVSVLGFLLGHPYNPGIYIKKITAKYFQPSIVSVRYLLPCYSDNISKLWHNAELPAHLEPFGLSSRVIT